MPPEPRERSAPRDAKPGPYQLFMLALCIYAIAALVVGSIPAVSPTTRQILAYADIGVCALFFADFVAQLVRAEDRWRYLRRWGWLDLISSIPMVSTLRIGRLARALRIIRVLRGVRAARVVSGIILERRAESAFLGVTLGSLFLIVLASIAVLELEQVAGANIATAQDAIWWAFATVTTVGYGDHFPVTSEGRLVAVLLMTAGVGLFATFSGFVASSFLAPGGRARGQDIRELREEIASLRRLLQESRPVTPPIPEMSAQPSRAEVSRGV